jgi:regulator of replication initiation timing
MSSVASSFCTIDSDVNAQNTLAFLMQRMALMDRDMTAIKEDNVALKGAIQVLYADNAALKGEVKVLHADNAGLRIENRELNDKVTGLQDQVSDLTTENAKLRDEKDSLAAKLKLAAATPQDPPTDQSSSGASSRDASTETISSLELNEQMNEIDRRTGCKGSRWFRRG